MDPEILRSSFAVVERRAEFAVKYFYSHLFRHHPDVRELFPLDFPEDMERQRDRLFAALTHVVGRLEDPALAAYLGELGRDHRKYLAQPRHYAAVGTSLLAAFAAVAGPAWNAEVEKAWGEAYETIADAMLRGASRAEDDGEPPWWDAEVLARRCFGQDVVVLTLRPVRPLAHLPGQYVSVSVPCLPGIWRPYSVGNAPRPDHTLDLHVSRVEEGLLSTALVRRTRVGDLLRLGAPSGGLTLRPPEDRPVTFIAAGTGWAPVKALLEQLVRLERPERTEHTGRIARAGTAGRDGAPYDSRLFVVARDLAHVYDRSAIEKLRARLPRLVVTFITPAPGRPRAQATERLLTALGNRANWAQHDVYLAGPAKLVEEVGDALPALGTAPERIFHDLLPSAGECGIRPSGPAEWFLARHRPSWHNPASREPGH
ncbi:globin domain-containing protein [Streptomyces sp. NPDC005551]|uniref:globin domain-containing protein n=1 Tax=unclassified Streptomyces TaxID=2593676 RepID=UPI0033FF5692